MALALPVARRFARAEGGGDRGLSLKGYERWRDVRSIQGSIWLKYELRLAAAKAGELIAALPVLDRTQWGTRAG